MNKILQTIKQRRLLRGLSQAVIARRLNITKTAYGKIERGQTELTLKRLAEICSVLELNLIELTKVFRQSSKSTAPMTTEQNELTTDTELDLSRKVNYIFKMFVNSLVDDRYRQIMLEYPYTEFTAQDWWDSLGEDKEKELGMTEKEFWDTYSCGYTEIFEPEDEYEGFKKLIDNHYIFYFFRFGLIDDNKLNSLFLKYCDRENITAYGLNATVSATTISSYLKTLTGEDVYEEQPEISAEQLSNYVSSNQTDDLPF